MNKYLAIIGVTLFACGAPVEGEDQDQQLGQVEQPVGFANNDGGYYWGVKTISVHSHTRCLDGNSVCSLPRTKGPKFFIETGLTDAQKTSFRAAAATLDVQTNWSITETSTESQAQIIVNGIPDFCHNAGGMESIVCVNLGALGNTLSEPVSIPNTYTEHLDAVLHLDVNQLNATPPGAARDNLLFHAWQLGILTYMGAGPVNPCLTDPAGKVSPSCLVPGNGFQFATGNLSVGEVCKLNKFLPAAQFGTSTTIGYEPGVHCGD